MSAVWERDCVSWCASKRLARCRKKRRKDVQSVNVRICCSRGSASWKEDMTKFLPQLTIATYQPACLRLIIGRAQDWEQFALPIFSSTKLLSDIVRKLDSFFFLLFFLENVLTVTKTGRCSTPNTGETGTRCLHVFVCVRCRQPACPIAAALSQRTLTPDCIENNRDST